jgi:hypothetical protein
MPVVPEGMRLRTIQVWEVRDECGKPIATYPYKERSLAEAHAARVRERGELYGVKVATLVPEP